jgi:hypothetical protein
VLPVFSNSETTVASAERGFPDLFCLDEAAKSILDVDVGRTIFKI